MEVEQRNPIPALFRLTGRVALVTGAAGHLGQAITKALAEAGAHVVLAGRNEERLKDLHDLLADAGFETSIARTDVTSEEDVTNTLTSIERRHQRLDILVNNAYSASQGGTLATVGVHDFAQSYDVAVVGAFRLLAAARSMLKEAAKSAGQASVINISSMYGTVSPDQHIYDSEARVNPPNYGAAKAALLQLTRYAACELAPDGIRVNSISPGPFPHAAAIADNPAFVHALQKKVPLGRIGNPEELKGAVLFLASDAASYVTGINLPVDGGWTAW